MKPTSLMLRNLLLIFIFSSFLELNAQKLVYFDTLNKPISKSKFLKLKKTRKYLDVKGEKENQRVLIVRHEEGVLKNLSDFYERIEQITDIKHNRNNMFVIVYYPGKDQCNSSGTATRRSIRKWYNDLERGANKITPTNTLYFYKDSIGLFKKNDGYKTWHKDPDDYLQRMFFKHHYPCSSFVVISPYGVYASYFGEFSKQEVWKYLKSIKNLP